MKQALEDLHVSPQKGIALEDSPHGVLAAKRAGLFCVAVPNPMTQGLALDRADIQVDSLADLPLHRLLKLAEAACVSREE